MENFSTNFINAVTNIVLNDISVEGTTKKMVIEAILAKILPNMYQIPMVSDQILVTIYDYFETDITYLMQQSQIMRFTFVGSEVLNPLYYSVE